MAAVGTAADNAMMESFWGRLQVWAVAANNSIVVQAELAKTAATLPVDDGAAAGLSALPTESIGHTHQHPLLNNDQAA